MSAEPGFTPLDLQNWKRGQVFAYFSKMAPTGYSITIDMDITHMREVLCRKQMKFFPTYLWLVTKNLNRQPEFKLAEKNGRLGYYDILTPLYAAFHEDDQTFSLMWTEYSDRLDIFTGAIWSISSYTARSRNTGTERLSAVGESLHGVLHSLGTV